MYNISLIIAVLITSVLSLGLGVAVATLVLYCYKCTHHRPAPDSLSSIQLQPPPHSATEASEYQDVVPKHTGLKSNKLDNDVSLMQNTAYGHTIHICA